MYQLWVSQVTGKMRNCGSKNSFSCLNLSGHKNDPINLLSEVEKNVLQIVRKHPGISRINIIPITGKSEATVKRALKALGDMGFVEYRGSNKTGGYFSL